MLTVDKNAEVLFVSAGVCRPELWTFREKKAYGNRLFHGGSIIWSFRVGDLTGGILIRDL